MSNLFATKKSDEEERQEMKQTSGEDMLSLLEAFQAQGVIQLGEFTLKSGQLSPIYIDLRVLITTPKIMKNAARALCLAIGVADLDFDYIVGVPYGAIMLATLVSASLDKPMLLKRKEAKTYGGKCQMIEGLFEAGKRVLVIEDVVTSGASIMETVVELRAVGLRCDRAFCVLDREQGGTEHLQKEGIIMHSLIQMSSILDFLTSQGIIDETRKAEIIDRLRNPIYAQKYPKNQSETTGNGSVGSSMQQVTMPKCGMRCEADADEPSSINWDIRSRLDAQMFPQGSLNNKLAEIMLTKKSNLCLAVDFTRKEEILKVVESVKEHVCAIKLHYDIITDFDANFVNKMRQLASDHQFLIVEDRKYSDTGATVKLQLTSGPVPVAEWADLVTVHPLPGPSSIAALKPFIDSPSHHLSGILLIAQLSTDGAMTGTDYSRQCVRIARECPASTVSGFICQQRCHNNPAFLYWTPGVNLNASGDDKGQRWRSVEKAIGRDGCDVVVVGRGITGAEDIGAEAKRYAQAGWEALSARKSMK